MATKVIRCMCERSAVVSGAAVGIDGGCVRDAEMGQRMEEGAQCALNHNWLQVSGTAERSQVDQRVRHQLHAIVPLLDAFKTQQQALELIFPRKGPLDPHA